MHPLRFPSATGLTAKLVSARGSGQGTPRDRAPLGMFSQNVAQSSFGGKYGESKQWLTPRGEVGRQFTPRNLARHSNRHPSGSQTERGRDRRADRRADRDLPAPAARRKGLQNVQGVTWRFLREGPRRPMGREEEGVLGAPAGSGLGGATGSDQAQQDAQLASVLRENGLGGGAVDGAADYAKFQAALQGRFGSNSRAAGPGSQRSGEQELGAAEGVVEKGLEASSDSSDDSDSDVASPGAAVAGAQSDSEGETGFDVKPSMLAGASAAAKAAGGGGAGGGAEAVATTAEGRGAGLAGGGGGGTKMLDYNEDEAYLANPAMAPCVIWHTPMRVKMAANLPPELRGEAAGDDAFVRDQRVVPDIWDHKFLPVMRRTICAPLPKDSAKYRGHNYGAWYLPTSQWGAKREADDKAPLKPKAKHARAGKGSKRPEDDDEEVQELLDKALREVLLLRGCRVGVRGCLATSAATQNRAAAPAWQPSECTNCSTGLCEGRALVLWCARLHYASRWTRASCAALAVHLTPQVR